jgi:hypothetical protein
MKAYHLLAVALLLIGICGRADTLTLTNGERFVGRIIAEEPGKIIFESQTAGKLEVPRNQIDRLERSQSPFPAPPATTNAPQTVRPTGTFYPWLTESTKPGSRHLDWIQLTSGEWLRGKIKSMQEEKLEFDSEELDNRTFDWEKIRMLYSPRFHSVRIEGIQQVTSMDGSLFITTNQVQVMSPEATNSFAYQDLVAITPTGSRELDKWSAHISAGMSLRSGNTREVDYNAHATIQRRTPSTRLTFDYLGNYGQLNGVQTEQNHRFMSQFDYFFSRRLFLRLPYVEYYKDPLQNIDHRLTLGSEVGYDIVRNRRVEWNLSAGPGWQRNWFLSTEQDENRSASSGALILGSKLDVEMTKRLDFILQYRGQFTGQETGNNTHHGIATLEFEIHKRLNLDISFTWDRIANPETDASGHTPVPDDFRLNLGLGIDF